MLFAEESSGMSLFSYLAIGGGGVALLAILLACIPKASIKIPAAIASGLGGLAAGVGLGVLLMLAQGYEKKKATDGTPPISPEEGMAKGSTPGRGGMGGGPPGGGGMMGGGMPGMGGGPPGGGGMMGGGGRGPNSKAQLATLITKLDQLTAKPLTVNLTAELKAKVQEQLKGLADAEELRDDDAKKRLDALLEILKGEKETMEAAGYRWPGQGGGGPGAPGGGPPADMPNPFKTPENGKKLKALQERLEDKKG